MGGMNIEKLLRENMLKVVAAYRKATGKSLDAVSREFYGKTPFLREFAAGNGSISIKKYGHLYRLFLKRWPAGGDFPFLRSIVFEMKKSGTTVRKGLVGRPSNRIFPPDHEDEPTKQAKRRNGTDAPGARRRDDRVAGPASARDGRSS